MTPPPTPHTHPHTHLIHPYCSGPVPLTTNSVVSGFEMRDPTRGGLNTINMRKKRNKIFRDADNTW